MAEMALSERDVYQIADGPLGCGEVDAMPVDFKGSDGLTYPYYAATTHPRLLGVKRAHEGLDIFAAIRKSDILLHHPYNSFATSTQLFVEAAARGAREMRDRASAFARS